MANSHTYQLEIELSNGSNIVAGTFTVQDGEQGPKGDTGATGPKGATGATGPQGVSITNVTLQEV